MPISVDLTPEQSRALETRDTSIALAAGAGCGKTFVLSQRFLSHLDHDSELLQETAKLHQLIAITFTDAAAREMRRRIRQTCYDRSQSAPTRESQDAWHRLLRAIEAARVSTIHAFCTSLLREHAVEAGLDPAFGVLDQGAADVLVSEVIDDVLRTRLADGDDVTLRLAAASGLSKLKDQLRELLKSRHEPMFDRWRAATVDEVLAVWQHFHTNEAFPAALAELAELPELRRIVELLQSVTPPPQKEKFVEAKIALLELLPQLQLGQLSEPDLQTLRGFAVVSGVCSAKDWPQKESYDAYLEACKRLRAAIDKQALKPFDSEKARETAELGLLLVALASDVAAEYERQKSQRGKLDFDDLLARAYQLLADPDRKNLRERMSSDLRLLLVDEFQDTDPLQGALVRLLCGDVAAGKLFFVGDVNQSIYRFRGAQPKVFLDLQAQVSETGKLPLTRNFRSQPAILNFVNALFRQTLGDKYQPLRPNRSQITAEPAVEFLWTMTPDKRSPGGKTEARGQEARRIACRLKQLIESKEPIISDASEPSGKRPLRPGDVAILFRALSDVALYESALRDYELKYYLVGGHAFYAQQEIYDVLNLLRAVASPADEISLAGVLRSPFFSLADESLFWLVETGGTLNDGLFGGHLPTELPTEERLKVAAAAETIADLRARKDSLSITAILNEALTRTGYDAALLTEFLGERKLANLNKLLEQARTADTGNVLDLTGFISQLAEFVVREPKEALAATLSESADVIRLMTIHGAKGLEFPLVIVVDVDRRPDFRIPAAALDEHLGPVIAPPDDEEERPTTGIDLYRTIEKRLDRQERQRLLYVATTRAADYLILSSSLVALDVDKLEGDWMKLLADRFDLESGAFRGDLPPNDQSPRVRVTSTDPALEFKPGGHQRGRELLAMVEDVHDLAAGGGGIVPPDVGPIAPNLASRSQFSVSRLSGRLVRPELHHWLSAPPPDAVDPRGLGTLVHAVLERINHSSERSIAPLCEQLAADIVVHNAARAAMLATDMLERFIGSPRWSQIAAATTVHRELEFLLAWPPDGTDGGGHYLQGFLDCLYQDASGAWHLVDYKTNDVTANEVPRAAADYEMQMYAYAMAVERSLGRPAAELTLVFLRPGVEHTFAWNDAARRRGIELVNDAMCALVAGN